MKVQWVEFTVGLFLGGFLGIVLMSLLVISRADEHDLDVATSSDNTESNFGEAHVRGL